MNILKKSFYVLLLRVTINSPSGPWNGTHPTYEYFLVLVCNIYIYTHTHTHTYIYIQGAENSMPKLHEVMGDQNKDLSRSYMSGYVLAALNGNRAKPLKHSVFHTNLEQMVKHAAADLDTQLTAMK